MITAKTYDIIGIKKISLFFKRNIEIIAKNGINKYFNKEYNSTFRIPLSDSECIYINDNGIIQKELYEIAVSKFGFLNIKSDKKTLQR